MSLADRLDEELAPDDRERFVVDGPKTADWCLRKIARARARQAEHAALANAEVERIRAWQQEEDAKLGHGIDFFSAMLISYHRQVMAVEPDRKTIRLPAGRLVARKLPAAWTFTDDFTAWAQATEHRAGLVRVTVEPDKAEVKRRLAIVGAGVIDGDTGEYVPGVTVQPGDVRYSVEVGQ